MDFKFSSETEKLFEKLSEKLSDHRECVANCKSKYRAGLEKCEGNPYLVIQCRQKRREELQNCLYGCSGLKASDADKDEIKKILDEIEASVTQAK